MTALSGSRSGSGHVVALDGWRGIAILLVLVGHFAAVGGVELGALGVELFFVLSGRLMAEILFVRKLDLPTFFYRRATRIIPGIAVFVILTVLVLNLIVPNDAPSALWIPLSLTFLVNYAYAFGYASGWLDHLWSLCVEEHSYLLLGLIAFLFSRATGRTLLAIWFFGIAAMLNGVISILVLGNDPVGTYFRSDVHLASIFVSAAIYLTLRSGKHDERLKRVATPAVIGCIVVGALASLNALPILLHYTLGTLAFALAVSLIDLSHPKLRAVFEQPVLIYAGLWSYSLYLWQQPFYKFTSNDGANGPLMLLLAIACGLASFYLIERPARKWLNARWPFGVRTAVQKA